MPSLKERFQNSWNAFMGRDPTTFKDWDMGFGTSFRPDKYRSYTANSRTMVNSIYNQIAVDISSINIQHVKLTEDGFYESTVKDSLNYALTKSANLDQSGKELIQDLAFSMFDEGVVALVPVLTEGDPRNTNSYKIHKLRVAKIVEWFPHHIKVDVYNEDDGQRHHLIFEKRVCAIVTNPFYNIMNEQNSLVRRLIRVLAQLDRTNENNSSGKLDLLFQLPYPIKGEARKAQAEDRRKSLERQLNGAQYGIGYIDATEKVIQLNRSVENNLWTQAQELTVQLMNQLGYSEAVFNGTADEQTMLNYHNRTLIPCLNAITDSMDRKWITDTARTQGHAIAYFQEPFKLIPTSKIAELSDKMTRNEILTSNEVRSFIGMRPSNDPKANELRNANLNHPDENGKKEDIEVDEKIEEENSK